tara:strand:- start:339 stop:656 length:318 start_codon:yes stop_codon:yes gene_type:complete
MYEILIILIILLIKGTISFIKPMYMIIRGLIDEIRLIDEEPINELHSIASLLKEGGFIYEPTVEDVKNFAKLTRIYHGSTMGTVIRKDVFDKVVKYIQTDIEKEK